MADQIREYVIKIKADVQEALKEIDQLSGKFDKIEIKTNVDKNFESRMKSIKGSIAKVIQEVNSLKSSFKDVDVKQLFNFKDAFSVLQGSIDQIKESAKTLADTFDFSNTANNGLSQFVNELKNQINDLVKNYSDAITQIQDLSKNGFIPDTTRSSSNQNSIQKVSDKVNQGIEELQNAKSNLKKATKEFGDIWDDLLHIMDHGTGEDVGTKKISQYISVVEKLQSALDVMNKKYKSTQSGAINDVYEKFNLTKATRKHQSTLDTYLQRLLNLQQQITDNTTSDKDGNANNVNTTINFGISYRIFQSDNEEEQNKEIQKIIDEIK